MGFMPVVCNRGRPLNPRPWPVPPGHHLARSYGCVLRPGRIYLFIYLFDDGQQDQGARLKMATGHGSNARIDHRTELEEGQEPVPCSKGAHGGG